MKNSQLRIECTKINKFEVRIVFRISVTFELLGYLPCGKRKTLYKLNILYAKIRSYYMLWINLLICV